MKLSVKAKIREHRGILECGPHKYQCALGPAGLVCNKQEGDGGTPLGQMRLTKVYYRPDRLTRPETKLPVIALQPNDGWCDDPTLPQYNQHVKLPFEGSHEKMWIEDHVYDICVVLDWNLSPAVPDKGSAIFFHLARENYMPTEGCIAVSERDMRALLAQCGPDATFQTQIET